jgi:hypothetical protein
MPVAVLVNMKLECESPVDAFKEGITEFGCTMVKGAVVIIAVSPKEPLA